MHVGVTEETETERGVGGMPANQRNLQGKQNTEIPLFNHPQENKNHAAGRRAVVSWPGFRGESEGLQIVSLFQMITSDTGDRSRVRSMMPLPPGARQEI